MLRDMRVQSSLPVAEERERTYDACGGVTPRDSYSGNMLPSRVRNTKGCSALVHCVTPGAGATMHGLQCAMGMLTEAPPSDTMYSCEEKRRLRKPMCQKDAAPALIPE